MDDVLNWEVGKLGGPKPCPLGLFLLHLHTRYNCLTEWEEAEWETKKKRLQRGMQPYQKPDEGNKNGDDNGKGNGNGGDEEEEKNGAIPTEESAGYETGEGARGKIGDETKGPNQNAPREGRG